MVLTPDLEDCTAAQPNEFFKRAAIFLWGFANTKSRVAHHNLARRLVANLLNPSRCPN